MNCNDGCIQVTTARIDQMATSVLEFITGRKQKSRAAESTAWQRYRELIEKFVDGTEVDTDLADQILDEAGQNESDLQRDVDVLTERRRLARQLADCENAEQALRTELATIEELVSQLRDFESKIHPKIQAARERYNAAERKAHQRSSAAAKLYETVMDPALLDREKALVKENAELNSAIRDLDNDIKSLNLPYYETQVANLRGKTNGFPWTKEKNSEELDRYQGELTRSTAERDRLNAKRAPLATRAAEIHRERTQIENQKLIP